MPPQRQRRRLSTEELSRAIGMLECGSSQRRVANVFSLSQSVISRAWNCESLRRYPDTFRPLHFINKSQSAYLKSLKENIPENAVIMLSDLAENYSFVVQDAVQGPPLGQQPSHYSTLSESDKVTCLSMCVISDW